MSSLSVTCPKCDAQGALDSSWAGKQIHCRQCGTTFTVPAPSAALASPLETAHERAAEQGRLESLPHQVGAESLPHAASGGEAAVPVEWQPGQVILGLYEVLGLLGEGGMGRVYRVRHRGWNTDLAVKSPRPEFFASAGGAESFEREAETWVNLGLHPHIVSCYYVRRLGGIPRVFAEYVEGGSLKDWIESDKLYEGGRRRR
jgi:serine/threonine protein kinase